MKKNVRNGEIELWRGVFCLIVFLFHLSLDSSSPQTLFQKGQIGVEFFFLLSGLFMAKAADGKRQKEMNSAEEIGKESIRYVIHKYMALFPYHAFAFLVTFLMSSIRKALTLEEFFERSLVVLPQFFLVHLAGFMDYKVLSIEWYVSSMLVGMLFVYPLLRKFYDAYVFVIGPLLTLSIFGYMWTNIGHLMNKYTWNTVTTNGVLRAIAIMNAGCLAYEIAKMLQKRESSIRERALLSLACLAGYGITIYFASSDMKEKVRFVLVFLLMFSVAISFSGSNLYGKYLNHRVFRFIGKVSLPFYLNTNMVRHALKAVHLNDLRYRYFVAIGILANFVLSSFLVIVIEKYLERRRERRVSL